MFFEGFNSSLKFVHLRKKILKYFRRYLLVLNKNQFLMRIKISHSIIVTLLVFPFFFLGCSNKNNKIELSFQLNKIEAFTSSDQLVIWLEKPDSTFVKTLFISDYLAYGGFALTTICTDWSGRTNWNNITKEEFDAITAATPTHGNVEFDFEIRKESVPDGEYNLFIEVHLAEDYNELYSGTVNLCEEKYKTELTVNYIPKKHPQTTETLLSDVKVSCN